MTAQALAATHAAAFADTRPWSAEEFASLLAQPSVILFGDARSFILARIVVDEAEVLTLATHPDFQRQQRAITVLRDFLAHARTAQVTEVFLEVAETNEPAKALYKKAGFQITGHRPAYYETRDGRRTGADVLRLALHEANPQEPT